MKVLDDRSSLSPGCELWIVTDPSRSAWARRIDWYLNFQMNRAATHRTPQISPELQAVVTKWEFEAPRIELPEHAPLLVGSSKLLPNKQTVLVPLSAEFREWVDSCYRVWSSLGKPTARIFLPDEVVASDFEAVWPAAELQAQVEIVSQR